jgi:hypothetical protein
MIFSPDFWGKDMAIRDEIAALYEGILGRAADQVGLDYFTNAVTSGAGTLADVARDMRASPEAQGLLGPTVPAAPVVNKPVTPSPLSPAPTTGMASGMPPDAARSFVGSLYNNILLRQGEQGGMDYWTGLLTSGRATPAEVEAAIRGSAEGQGVQIGTRQVPFGSQAVGGNVYQMAQYNAPRNLPPSIQSAFQQSLDYQAALPYMIPQFNPADIPATYQQIAQPRQRLDISNITVPEWLKEAAKKDQAATEEVAGEKAVEKTVTPAVTTGGVTTTNVGSQQTATTPSWITNAYAQYLGRAPETAGANYWAQQAAAGVPIADLVATIAASPEAQGLLGK